MSISEFKWNKKRKHYAYIHKKIGTKRLNILLSSKPYVIRKGKVFIINIRLIRHPNPKNKNQFYVIPRNYLDDYGSFDQKALNEWVFDKNDKRKIKRIKKIKKNKKMSAT